MTGITQRDEERLWFGGIREARTLPRHTKPRLKAVETNPILPWLWFESDKIVPLRY